MTDPENRDIWESLTPEDHDDAAEFFDERAAEGRTKHKDGDQPAVTDKIRGYVLGMELRAQDHREAAERKRKARAV